MPCGHSVCEECVGKIKSCPTCRADIKDSKLNYAMIEMLSETPAERKVKKAKTEVLAPKPRHVVMAEMDQPDLSLLKGFSEHNSVVHWVNVASEQNWTQKFTAIKAEDFDGFLYQSKRLMHILYPALYLVCKEASLVKQFGTAYFFGENGKEFSCFTGVCSRHPSLGLSYSVIGSAAAFTLRYHTSVHWGLSQTQWDTMHLEMTLLCSNKSMHINVLNQAGSKELEFNLVFPPRSFAEACVYFSQSSSSFVIITE